MKHFIASYIDHTLLQADATSKRILSLCEEAKKYQFASVCVNPFWVSYAKEILTEEAPAICTVIGFPLGSTTTKTKQIETKDAILNGATEIDMVINIAALKEKNNSIVEEDIRAVVEATKGQAIVKVIIEACLLTNEEKVRACELSVQAGAHYVKTSTGFSTGGAMIEDIQLMRKTVGSEVGVKASGGIRTLDQALAMIEAGATRIGASAGISIVEEAVKRN